jgi:TRAP-type C4-dicarboxylate transport system substrate-binding protein
MTFVVVMNREAYDGLPDELQIAFDKHFGPEGQAEWGRLLAQGEVDARSQMIEAGAIVRGLSEADAAKFASVSVELRERAAAQLDADGLDGTGFLEALMAASEAYR